MKNICIYFQIHQPYSLKRYRFFDIDQDHYYYDDFRVEENIRRLAEKSYLPPPTPPSWKSSATPTAASAAPTPSRAPRWSSWSSTRPKSSTAFKELAKTGAVEFLAEPYAHSLASVYDADEFERQVKNARRKDRKPLRQKSPPPCATPSLSTPTKSERPHTRWATKPC